MIALLSLFVPLTIAQAPDGLKALKNPDPRVRFKAAATLARLGPLAKFAAPELQANLGDEDPYVRLKIVEALFRIQAKVTPPASKALIQALHNKDPNIASRASAVCGILGEEGHPFVDPLIQNLRHSDVNVRMDAIQALQDLGPIAKSSFQPLLDLADDKDFDLLEPLIEVALAQLGPEVVRTLGRTLEGRDIKKRRLAAGALAISGPDAKVALRSLVETLVDDDAILRTQAARAVGRIGVADDKTLQLLRRGTEDKDAFVRIQMALAYSLLSQKTDRIGVIQRGLTDDSALVRSTGCQALGELGSLAKEAVPELRKLVKGEDETTRLRAVETLGKIGPAAETAIPDLLPLLKSEDGGLQIESALAIWLISKKADSVTPTLIKEVDRLRAVQVLEKIGPPALAAIPALLDAYQDDEEAYREAVRRAIKAIDPAAAKKAGIR